MTSKRLKMAIAAGLGVAALGNLPLVPTVVYAANACGNGSVCLWDQGGWIGVTKSSAGAVADYRTVVYAGTAQTMHDNVSSFNNNWNVSLTTYGAVNYDVTVPGGWKVCQTKGASNGDLHFYSGSNKNDQMDSHKTENFLAGCPQV
jgi:hypothetical protein